MTVPVHDLPPALREGITVVVVPPRLKGPRSYEVISASDPEPGQLVSLRGVRSLKDAEPLVGRVLLVAEEDLPSGFALHDRVHLVGRTISDASTHAEIGVLSEVYAGIANDVWTIDTAAGERWDVPVIDLIVQDVPRQGPIPIRVLPEHIIVTPASEGDVDACDCVPEAGE